MAKAFPAPKLERMERSFATLCKSLEVKKVNDVTDCCESSERNALPKTKCRTMHIRCTELPNPQNRQSPWRFPRALSKNGSFSYCRLRFGACRAGSGRAATGR